MRVVFDWLLFDGVIKPKSRDEGSRSKGNGYFIYQGYK